MNHKSRTAFERSLEALIIMILKKVKLKIYM